MSSTRQEFKCRDFVKYVDCDEEFEWRLREKGGAGLVYLLRKCISLEKSNDIIQLEKTSSEARQRIWEYLHSGNWKDIDPIFRRAYADASIFHAVVFDERKHYTSALKTIDFALILAGTECFPSHIHELVAYLERRIQASDKKGKIVSTGDYQHAAVVDRKIKYPLENVSLPSLFDFQMSFMQQNTPVVIYGAMDCWPALGHGNNEQSWKNLDYFRSIAGLRSVPVEIGRSYMDDDWGQKIMTINNFMDEFIFPPSNESQRIAYLAQYPLFDQIPRLAKDIQIPDYCSVLRQNEDLEADTEVTVNAWFGPQHTISPLHYDPKDNLLCQVFGTKYIRLYAPDQTQNLYPSDGLMSNTSQVDITNVDTQKFPDFSSTPYLECILEEGQMLYIPPKNWHYVESLSVSCSVNFWW
uniref:Uncharacterized protein AlNc14C170G7977 n=1 Tax=Albugo laibachii Nc14 TaxID=890382 RepID=F0WNF0_9STRA|nr:conserved hypothetical protein [Albugo laibachii Nc14]|eukprot:CCA22841.1 conserved hypothetical protein [Albugo laibachii Nc14]